jgi:hypothetical protein
LSSKNKPFLACRACNTRTFFGSWAALTGTAVVTPLVSDHLKKMKKEPAVWDKSRELGDALYREFVASVQGESDGAETQDDGRSSAPLNTPLRVAK